MRFRWSRICKHCGIKALTGERIHDQCFVCGPKAIHYQPPLPSYPQEWDTFINHRATASVSRKLNSVFTLTALGVYDGDFMKFPDAHEGQHAIRWFIHDPNTLFTQGEDQNIPRAWIDSVLAGLRRVNPFINKLESLRTADDESDLALHLEPSEAATSNQIAAIVSLAPASPPARRKIIIRKKGKAEAQFLDLLSPFVEPLHYLLLLPHGGHHVALPFSNLRLLDHQQRLSSWIGDAAFNWGQSAVGN
ncbi:hypothetical protein C8R45DRAFT_1114600 [Mycena sanguinolenta]|nr:hypothetical protein C8R45DRAFT_1114600 [Mycena sanguinolenta]